MKTETTTNEIDISKLKSIREAKNISEVSLADDLKVSKDFINHIESGSFDKLGAPTFVKGHVTNYCKALGLDVAAVLAQVPIRFLQVQSLKPSDAVGASPLARVKRRSNYLGKYAVGTALLGMLGLSFYFVWDKWSFNNKADSSDISLLADEQPEIKTNHSKNITYSSLLPQVGMQNVDDSDPQPVSEDLNTTNATDDEELLVPAETEVPAQEDPTTAETLVNDALLTAKYSIELELNQQSWVSIQTTDGEKLVHDLIGPGTQTYQSEQAVHVRIGNAKNAQVTINNLEVDLNPFMKRDIADFNWPNDPS